jgi:hypothetical protein
MRDDSVMLLYDMIAKGDSFIPDCIMIKEGKESLVIGRMGGDRLAIIMRIPLITILQKTLLNTLI